MNTPKLWQVHISDMTLRDYFAAHAPDITVASATFETMSELAGISLPTPGGDWAAWSLATRAAWAYRYADAMLAERAKAAGREVEANRVPATGDAPPTSAMDTDGV